MHAVFGRKLLSVGLDQSDAVCSRRVCTGRSDGPLRFVQLWHVSERGGFDRVSKVSSWQFLPCRRIDGVACQLPAWNVWQRLEH